MSDYIKKFGTSAAWEAYRDSCQLVTPNVSFVEEEQKVYYTPMNEVILLGMVIHGRVDCGGGISCTVSEFKVKPGFFDVQPTLRDVPFANNRMAFVYMDEIGKDQPVFIPLITEEQSGGDSYPTIEELVAAATSDPYGNQDIVDIVSYGAYEWAQKYTGTDYATSQHPFYTGSDYQHLLQDLETYRVV